MICGFSWCLFLRKAKCELKRVTEYVWAHVEGLGRVGTRWAEMGRNHPT